MRRSTQRRSRSARRARSLVAALAALAALGASGCESGGRVAGRAAADVTSAKRGANVVEAWGKKLVDDEWVAGLVITLVKGGQVETHGFGRVADGAARVPDRDTAFEIASVTKVFTAALLADAVGRGEVRLDQRVNELLPELARLGGRAASITLGQLATHTSGLPRLPPNLAPASDANPYADYTRERLFAALPSVELEATPGAAFSYSNFGAGLLGEALALRAGKSYEAMVRERIAEPLGMTRTGIARPADNVAQGHDDEGRPAGYWDHGSLHGAGALVSTAADLARFARAFLGSAPEPLRSALASTLEPQTRDPLPAVGLGWQIGLNRTTLTKVRWHNGETGGFHSFVALDVERHSAVIVLASQAGMTLDELGIALVQSLRGEPATFDLPRLVPVARDTLDAYVGTYELTPDFKLDVTREGGRLYVQATGQQRFRLYPESETIFNLRSVDASIEFHRAPDGPATELVLTQDQRTQVARRLP